MSLFATEKLPSPRAAVGVVSNDLPNRTLTVRLADAEQGYVRLLWKEAFSALRRSEQGRLEQGRGGHPTVYASTDSADRVIFGTAGDNVDGGLLRFAFYRGQSEYAKLIIQPGLFALVMLDRSSRRFLSVAFKHRQG